MAARRDLNELLLNVDPVKVLEALEWREGIDFQVHGAILRGRCPAHQGDNFNFAIELSKGLCSCYSHKCFYGAGRSIASVVFYRLGSWPKTFELLEAVAGSHPVKVYTNGYEYRVPTEGEVRNLRRNYTDYLDKRGISREIQDLFECGFHPGDEAKKPPRATLPVRFPDGSLLGVLGRRTDGGEDKKYFPVTGYFPAGRSWFGIYQALQANVHRGVWIPVEGPVSALKGWELGDRRVIGAMGSSISQDQVEILAAHADEVWVPEEPDKAGRLFVHDIWKKMGSMVTVYRVPLPDGCKDLGEVEDMDEWYDCLERRAVYAPN